MKSQVVAQPLARVTFSILILLTTPLLSAAQEDKSPEPRSTEAISTKLLIPHESWACGMADGIPAPEGGVLIFEAEMKLEQIYDVGMTQFGKRQAIIVQGGEFTGEKIKGTVLPGGLDYRLELSNGAMEIEQILVLRTSDGTSIFVRNSGVGPDSKDIRIVFGFEAPNASDYSWLHNGKFVGRRIVSPEAKTMKLSVYDVSDMAIPSDPMDEQVVRIAKPDDVPSQSWDYRKAEPSETTGEVIVTESVTLGGSVSIGATKGGNRNIIPITGGALSGKITGKILSAGADYQNLSNPATIDARYLWEAEDGEVIIVRNAGPFGSLVPTFEARVDGKYAWLNSGKFLSSNPGFAAGGVGLTFYESK